MLMSTVAIATAMAVVFGLLWLTGLLSRLLRHGSWWIGERTEADLAQLFVFVSARSLLLWTLLALVVVIAAGVLLRIAWPLMLGCAAVAAVGPRILVIGMRRARQRRLAAQLPDAISLWAGLLRSGQGVMTALSQVSSRQPEPLGGELKLVLAEHRLGLGLGAAIGALRDRVGVPDLRMLVTLLQVHRELGGNLAEAMDRLAATLRSRLLMEARIRSLTAQGRLQGLVVGALPLLLAVVLSVMEPDAMHAMVSTRPGWAAMAAIAGLEVAGFIVIRRIVNIDI
jgi:tight adherence protein B